MQEDIFIFFLTQDSHFIITSLTVGRRGSLDPTDDTDSARPAGFAGRKKPPMREPPGQAVAINMDKLKGNGFF